MKLVQINAVCGIGSTGRICVAISDSLNVRGIENFIFFSSGKSNHLCGICYMSSFEVKRQAVRSRILGNYGFNSTIATKRLISRLEEIQPNIIHLHNLHGHNVNLQILFEYIKQRRIKVFWTFHDCWAFTGYCPHYDMIGCRRWETHCKDCPQRGDYSWFLDRSQTMFERKRSLLSDLDLSIITPSKWMADMVKASFLREYPVTVINNGIDLNVFRPRPSDFREKYHCGDKFILLGVAFNWDFRKGIDVFVELGKRLDGRFQIVMVGADKKVDKLLPENIISIHRTQDQAELAEIYTAADLFVNPTREENYPTVNMESLGCGTPVLTFCTGGSPEIIDKTCGATVVADDIDALEKEIIRIYIEKPYSEECCLQRSRKFNQDEKIKEYLELYERAGIGRAQDN